MKENDFLDGISNVAPDIVERFISMDNELKKKEINHKKKSIWLKICAFASCFALIVGIIAVIPLLKKAPPDAPPRETAPTETEKPNDPTSNNIIDNTGASHDAAVYSEKSNENNPIFVVGTSSRPSYGNQAPPKIDFQLSGYIVKARVIKNYPDQYTKLDGSSRYLHEPFRLILMETLEVINGKNVPRFFLYLIEKRNFVDMSVHDFLIISMSQLGTEKYVLKNVSKGQLEYYELPIFSDSPDAQELGNVIAFKNGIFDESLWQNENWFFGYQFSRHYLDEPSKSHLIVKRGDSESDVIEEIKKRRTESYYGNPTVLSLDFKTDKAKKALDYVAPFNNGVFIQTRRYNVFTESTELIFRRYINGCETDETVTINLATEEVTYSEEKYSSEDIAKLQNLSAVISQKAEEYSVFPPSPPRITDTENKKTVSISLFAWYATIDGKAYGVVKTVWLYEKIDNKKIQYYDEAYVLYDMTDETVTDISREDLVKLQGYRNLADDLLLGAELPDINC